MTTMPQDAAETPTVGARCSRCSRTTGTTTCGTTSRWSSVPRKRALERPSNKAVWDAVHSLMNAQRPEFDKFQLEKLYPEFHDRFGYELNTIEATLRDCLLVRSYVDSLVALERARLTDIARIAAGNRDEVKAEYLRLPIAPFLDKARAEVEREHFNARAAKAAFGPALLERALGQRSLQRCL